MNWIRLPEAKWDLDLDSVRLIGYDDLDDDGEFHKAVIYYKNTDNWSSLHEPYDIQLLRQKVADIGKYPQ